jgi:hypothetical protein
MIIFSSTARVSTTDFPDTFLDTELAGNDTAGNITTSTGSNYWQTLAGSVVGGTLIVVVIIMVTLSCIAWRRRYQKKLQAQLYNDNIENRVYDEIVENTEPLYELVDNEVAERTADGLVVNGKGSITGDTGQGREQPDSTGTQSGEHCYEKVRIFDVSRANAGRGHFQVTDVSLSGYETIQDYELVPDVEILSAVGGYETAQVYERVPDVNFAQLLSIADHNSAQVSAAMLSTDRFNDRVSSVQTSEQIPRYESIHYGEMTLRLVRGVMQPYEQISGYERVKYRETLERKWKRESENSTDSQHWVSGYRRVLYSQEAMQLLKRMSGVISDRNSWLQESTRSRQ